jgi:uncharacterized protein (DUF433 family)
MADIQGFARNRVASILRSRGFGPQAVDDVLFLHDKSATFDSTLLNRELSGKCRAEWDRAIHANNPGDGRLEFDPNVSDSPVIKGTWVTVRQIVSLIVDGHTWSDILRSHPEITEADIRAALTYAASEDDDTGTNPTEPLHLFNPPAGPDNVDPDPLDCIPLDFASSFGVGIGGRHSHIGGVA